MGNNSEYYKVLGLTRDATSEEIREAYFYAARNFHPDTNPDPQANEQFLAIQDAYDVLSNPDRRLNYDRTLPPPAAPPQVQTATQFSRQVISQATDPQLFYTLIDISTPAEADKSQLPPANICLVIDRSTSMQGERMDMVKTCAAQLIKQLKPQDWISVVAFSDRAEVLVPPTRANEMSKFEGRISLLKTSGSTELFRGLQTGYDQLVSFKGLKTLKQLILLTDGHTYGDEAACLELAQKAVNEGITIHSLGFGHEWNDAFLDKLSVSSGGNALFIKSARDLSRFFESKVSSINAIYAKGMRLDFQLPPEVEVRYAFRIQPDCSPLGNISPLVLGDLQFKSHLLVLLEFYIKGLSEDVANLDLIKGRLWMDIVGRTESKARFFLDIKIPVQYNPAPEPPPSAILDSLSQITLYRLQEKARQEVNEGKIELATRHLQYLATNMLSQGNRALAHEVLVEAEHIYQSQSYSQDGDKRIKYGTRALMLPSGLEAVKL